MSQTVLINGKKQSKLSVFNRLTQFGDGLFETCVFDNARLLLANKHFERLEKGAQKLSIKPVDRSLFLSDIAKAISISKLKNGVVKIILSRGESLRGYGYQQDIEPTRIVIVSSIPDVAEKFQLEVCSSGYSNNQLLSEIKHCNRLEQILARTDLHSQECLMLDEGGFVISATQGNIFAIRNGVLLTPGLDQCGIEGTRRSFIFELAKVLNLKVEICALTLSELLTAEEVFITNSVIGIKPVSKINNQVFTQYEITKRLIHAYQKQIQKKLNSVDIAPRKRLSKLILIVVLAVFSLWAFWANSINLTKPFVYHLPKGANIYSTAANLKNHGLINSSFFAIWSAKLFNIDSYLKAGYYDISPSMGVISLLKDFSNAKVAVRDVTLIEGKTTKSYYNQLIGQSSLKSSLSFEQTMKALNIKTPYDGYIWPDTYQINYADSVLSVLKRAKLDLENKLTQSWLGRAKNHPLKNANQALILASLVEKETANVQEKAKIAGVFLNRLKKDMRLQTDPTVVYALGDKYTGSLSKKDLSIKSPYNTYRNKGLPPGPISSVSMSSLHAVMHPEKTQDLYFVAKKDGTHAFAKTYKQHLHNVNKYLKNL